MKKLIITGNVGRDVEVIATKDGNFSTFSVAVSVGTKANPKIDWVNVTCSGKLGEFASNYVKKGGKVLVEGFPGVNAYINKDNIPVATLKVSANTIELLSRAPHTDDEEDLSSDDNNSSDIPF